MAAVNKAAFNGIIGQNLGYMFALFLLGCSVGGFMFGRLGDKIGRVKTMIVTVLIYAFVYRRSALFRRTCGNSARAGFLAPWDLAASGGSAWRW